MPDEKRMIENYEVKTAIHIGGKEIIFAEDVTAELPFMVCECTWDNPFDFDCYVNAGVSADYVEVMSAFTKRLEKEVDLLKAERAERGISTTPLTAADCIPKSNQMDYAGEVIVLKPEKLASYARTPDYQLFLAIDGNGARAEARGNAVFCYNLYTGEHCRRERYNVAGIIDPAKMPDWANEKLAVLKEKLATERQSIMEKLTKAKQTVQEQPAMPRESNKADPEL